MTADYFAIDALNWSTLKNMRDSPAHYRYRLGDPIEQTPAMALGRVTHTLVFEPGLFAAEYAIYEGGDRRGKEWTEFRDANAGKTIFKPGEIDAAIAMADAVKAHPLVQPYLEDGLFEQPIQWIDPDNGLRCKAKPDWLLPKRRTLVDLKTTVSVNARRFGSLAARLGYHCQMAMYRHGIEHALGWRPERVLMIAVERDPPHDVAVFELDDETLIIGLDEVKQLMQQLIVCRAQDRWPGRYEEEQPLQLPGYLYGEVEFEYE